MQLVPPKSRIVPAWICLLTAALGVVAPTAKAADLNQLMTEARVPGISMALIRNGKMPVPVQAGVRNVTTAAPVDADTVFASASLSKPVFAYIVLQLVDAGVLSLDTQLVSLAPDGVVDDPRAAAITVRQVLSHTSGLPNWRGKNPLKTSIEPGERFSYSGEGFTWLQKAVETVTGEQLEALANRLVFRPLRMTRSSFVWQAVFDLNFADGHDPLGAAIPGKKGVQAHAAFSLQTTPADYARFMHAVLTGARLKPATARLWLTPQVRLKQRCYVCHAAELPEQDQRIAWGLGWGLEPDRGTFFHWGDNGRFKTFAIGSVKGRSALVIFTNGANGMAIIPGIVDRWMPGDRPVFRWLNYPRRVVAGR
jgi:CubicO group peptidase (beta-lactamase class C family)